MIADRDAGGLEETRKQIRALAADSQVQALECGKLPIIPLSSIISTACPSLQTPVDQRMCTDVSSESSVESFFTKAIGTFGRLDYACNVAGILMAGSSPEFSVADFDKQFAVNSRGMWLCQRAEITQMLKQDTITTTDSPFPARGAIANVASMAGLRAYDNLPSYCATKHSILGFTKADALRYAANHIRINAICPGVIATPMLGEIDEEDTTSIADMTKEMAMGRQGQPEEIAEALLWITSGRASFVTSTTLAVNGGKSVDAPLN